MSCPGVMGGGGCQNFIFPKFNQIWCVSYLHKWNVVVLGVCRGQKFSFLNMVMWHILIKWVISRPGYTEKKYPRIKLVTLGWDKMVKYHYISSRAWGLMRWRAIECVLVSKCIMIFFSALYMSEMVIDLFK